jgi:hypothetical protein
MKKEFIGQFKRYRKLSVTKLLQRQKKEIMSQHIFQMSVKDGDSFVPRVNQLDALALDSEIFFIFKGYMQSALKHFLR